MTPPHEPTFPNPFFNMDPTPPLSIGITEITKEIPTILPEDRRKHMAIFGKSGIGKTTLLRNMIVWDIHAGLGVTVIDSHGAAPCLETAPLW